MANQYGPWATSIGACGNPQLSAFWRQRLTKLVPTSQSSPTLSRRQMLAIAGAGLAACALPTVYGESVLGAPPIDAKDVTPEKVLSAWKKRRERTKSFRYEFASHRTDYAPVPRISPALPNAPNAMQPPREFHGTHSFSVSGKKMAYSSDYEGQEEPLDAPPQKPLGTVLGLTGERASFDTVFYKWVLGEHGPLPFGETTRDGEFTGRRSVFQARDTLTCSVDNIAPWLWFSPLDWLHRQSYDPDKMTIGRRHVLHDGRECVELFMPRSNPSWRGVVCVDPSRDCVPVEFFERLDGAPKDKLSIQYVRDETEGWRISAWQYEYPGDEVSGARSHRCKVTRCTINKPVADNVFAIEFPEGTHVVEHGRDTDKYFIAMRDGKRRYISQSEYGTPPPPEMP